MGDLACWYCCQTNTTFGIHAHVAVRMCVQLSQIGLEQPVAGLKLECQHQVALPAYGTARAA